MGRGYGPFFYAVNQGHQPGVYKTWLECEKNVKGFKGARFKKFSTFEEAEKFSKMPIKKPEKKPVIALETSNDDIKKQYEVSRTIVLSDDEENIDKNSLKENDKKIIQHTTEDEDYIPLTQDQFTDDDFIPLIHQQQNVGSFDTNDDFIPLTQEQDTNKDFIPVTKKRKYMDMDDNSSSSDDFLKRYGNATTATTAICDERIYNDIIINADGEEISDEPIVIQDLSSIMQTLHHQFDQYERLKQRNKWVYVDTMTWLKDCANNNWKTTAGKQITSVDIQKVMDALMQLKQCM